MITDSLTPERLATLTKEAEIRNATLAESIAQNLLDKACDSYAKTQADNYARTLYERIQAALAETRKAIFSAAEQALQA